MRFLVTGANGFVGRTLCDEIVRQGHYLRAMVRSLPRAGDLPGDRIEVPEAVRCADWPTILSGIDAVIHLAGRAHVLEETASDPLSEFRSANVRLAETLAIAAAACGTKRFVYVSSIKVNGEETLERPFTADDRPAPQDEYAISKWEGEQAMARVADATGMEVTIVRPPLVYGPGVGGNFLRLLKLVDRGVPLPFGRVDNRRSMIYSRNLADALIACATRAQAAGKVLLVSDGEDLSTADLVRRIGLALGRSARCFGMPPPALRLAALCVGMSTDVRRLVSSLIVDGHKICDELNWSPPHNVAAGLAETAKWYRGAAGRPGI